MLEEMPNVSDSLRHREPPGFHETQGRPSLEAVHHVRIIRIHCLALHSHKGRVNGLSCAWHDEPIVGQIIIMTSWLCLCHVLFFRVLLLSSGVHKHAKSVLLVDDRLPEKLDAPFTFDSVI